MASQQFEWRAVFPGKDTVGGSRELELNAVHFQNAVLLQMRLDGEMNCTVEVNQQGLRPLEQEVMARPLAGGVADSGWGSDEEEEETFLRDNLSDYQVVVKLGDSNDTKLPIVATQIAELYQRVVLPQLRKSGSQLAPLGTPDFSLVITLSSKIFGSNDTSNSDEDFAKLVFILQSIKEMYTINSV